MMREHIGFWLDAQKAIRLRNVAKRKGMKLSDLLRSAVDEILRREDDLPGVLLDEESVRKYLQTSGETPEWTGVEPGSLLACAIEYALRKYQADRRRISIFATIIEGFATGVWSGFGQEKDPLFQKAHDTVIKLAGGTPPNELGIAYLPALSKDERAAMTPDILKALENIIFWGEEK